MWEYIASNQSELLITFFGAFLVTALASTAENLYKGHPLMPCSKGGAIQGLVFGVGACTVYVLLETS